MTKPSDSYWDNVGGETLDLDILTHYPLSEWGARGVDLGAFLARNGSARQARFYRGS